MAAEARDTQESLAERAVNSQACASAARTHAQALVDNARCRIESSNVLVETAKTSTSITG